MSTTLPRALPAQEATTASDTGAETMKQRARDNIMFWTLGSCFLLVILSYCAGCAQQPPRTLVDSAKAIEIPAIVVEPCLDPAQIPRLPRSVMPVDADIRAMANGDAANATRILEVLKTQRDLLEGCAKLQPPPEKK